MKVHGTVNILGNFWPQRTSNIAEVEWSAEDEGRILYDSDNDDLYYGSSLGWVELTGSSDLFIAGTTLVFASTLPTGWNIGTDMDDKVMVLTNSTSQIGTFGGQWVITGLNSTGSHNHYTPGSMSTYIGGSVDAKTGTRSVVAAQTHKHTLPTKGSHIHTFDGNWRPARVKFAVGIYGG